MSLDDAELVARRELAIDAAHAAGQCLRGALRSESLPGAQGRGD